MKTLLILLITPLLIWSLMRALIVPLVSSRHATGGVVDGDLARCKSAGNCVTSSAADRNAIPPLPFTATSESQWQLLLDTVASLPGYKLVKREGDYAHFEARTPLMNYRDDLELLWHRDANQVAIRSASRLGIKDLGANNARVTVIRTLLELQQRDAG